MNLSVSDDRVIVNLNIQGIRNVTWGETKSVGYGNTKPWYLTITYKGSHNMFYYDTEQQVRLIFNKIREAMDAAYKESKI